MIDLHEFTRMVGIMRRLQKQFFRLKSGDRPPSLIREVIAAEKSVDRVIEEYDQGQGTLFGAEP